MRLNASYEITPSVNNCSRKIFTLFEVPWLLSVPILTLRNPTRQRLQEVCARPRSEHLLQRAAQDKHAEAGAHNFMPHKMNIPYFRIPSNCERTFKSIRCGD